MIAITPAPSAVGMLCDERGRAVDLGACLGRGGEGAVYEVAGRPAVVAKLYHQPPTPEQAAKLRALVELSSEPLRRIAAWPIATVHSQSGGATLGILLPRVVDHRPIHQLTGPASRLRLFPTADWRFLVHVAANLARAFAVIHAHGQVIGDVNQGNVLVAASGTVTFIDCDSFQIERNGRRFGCDVGVAPYQPPELQRLTSLRGLVRTPNHDNFGLAVLIFQLLLLGRHPYAGSYAGPGEMPLERAIAECRFVYRRGAAPGMKPPPGAPALDVASEPVAALFERAFGPEGARGGRPSATAWAGALERLLGEIAYCPRNLGHSYVRRLALCPWCELERRAGTVLFAPRSPTPATVPALDLAELWKAVDAVPSPGPAPPLPGRRARARLTPMPRARRLARLARILPLAAGVAALAGPVAAATGLPLPGWGGVVDLGALELVAATLWLARTRPRDTLLAARRKAREEWREIAERWTREAGDAPFLAKRADLEAARQAYLNLPATREQLRAILERRRRDSQLRSFLEPHPIAGARVKGIGPGREATLVSYGVETAADVTEEALRSIPGLGAGLRAELLAWRQHLEQGFVEDPRQPIDPRDLRAVEQELEANRRQIERALRAGPGELRALADQARRARQTLPADLARARAAIGQAEADLALVRRGA